ncbi:MAG: MoaD/ThiS family protein [Anaerolineaceae bacterium]
MKVTLRYFNILNIYTNCRIETVEYDAPLSLQQLVINLAQRFSPGFSQIALHEGKLAPHFRIFINGKPMSIEDTEVQIQDGDEIMMFPAVAGG